MSNINLNEVYDREIADRVANGVAEKHNLNSPQYIGAGDFGVAYDIGNDRVLKVTSDKSEAIENLKLIGKDLNYIAEPYSVQSITSKTTDIPETYTIILEKLKTDHGKIGRQMIRINYVFKEIFGVEFPDVIDHYIYGYNIGVDEESIENYLSKNPEDEKFFYDILHIGEEALKNGIQSMDYLNYNNLGYKKNGDLGFYDVGFGDLYSIPTEKPQEVEIDEDLEYNHVVGNATNDVYRLSERRKAWVDGAKAVEVKKKCRLAGLGNTSVACNQGDINNLTFKSLNEADIMSLQDLPFKEEIENLGGKIFSVGGAVRDEFIGKESKDLDILITGIPMDDLENILSKYGKVDLVGKSFGVIKFKPEGATEEIDVAIPRKEQATGEGGHKDFEITSDHEMPIEADLFRRDFTINAIAKDINGNIIDPYGGQEDLKNKIIRVVNPKAFGEDPLRMLRAVQFSSRFGFTIEPETLKLIRDNAPKIKEISPERILIELNKIVEKGDSYVGAFSLKNTGLLKHVFGQDASLYVGDEWDNVKTMGEFIMLLTHHVLDSPSQYYKDNLKGDIDTYKEIKALEFAFNDKLNNNPLSNRSIAHNIYTTSPKVFQSEILPDNIKLSINDLQSGKYPKNIKELAINGNDLMNLGYKGKEIGDTLKSLLLKTYNDEVPNNREDLLGYVNNNTTPLNENKRDVDFYVNKYNEWNGEGGYSKPTEVSVFEFLQNNYEDYSKDEELNKEILDTLSKEDIKKI